MKDRSILARRAAACLSAMALSATALVATSGSASAAPADPDLSGRVVNAAGVGIAGVEVNAYTTPADGSAPRWVTDVQTDATGHYTFTDLDLESLAASFPTRPETATETEFKLFFNWYPDTAADYHSTGYLDRGLGGTKSIRHAASVVIPAGAPASAPTQTLPTAGGILITLTGASGAPVTDYGWADLYDPQGADLLDGYVTGSSTYSDDDFYSPDPAPKDGLIYVRGVEPSSYLVQAGGSDYDPVTMQSTYYLTRFYGGNGTQSGATKVPVTAGAFTPIAIQLGNTMEPVVKPRIIGDASFGSKLTADPGLWFGGGWHTVDTEFSYQWLRGSTVVGTGETYKLTKKDKGAKIRLAVTAYRSTLAGTATSDATPKVGEKSKVKVTKVAGNKITVAVRAAKAKLAKKFGAAKGKVVLVTADGTVASKKVKLKAGVATLKAKKKFAGEKLFVLYLGGGKLGSDTVAVKGGKKK